MVYINIKTLMSLIFIVVVGIVHSQTSVPYGVYKDALQFVNPSYVGASKNTKIMASVRSQWSELERSPKTQYFSFSKPFKSNNIAFGFSIINDTYHINRETSAFADFSYFINIDENLKLGFGLKSGGSFLSIDFNSLQMDDTVFRENIESAFSPNIGSGIYLESDKYFAGFSIPRFFTVNFYEKKSDTYRDIQNPQVYLNFGYYFDVNNSLNCYRFVPSILLKHDFGGGTNLELATSITYNDKFEIALANRFNECFTAYASFNISKIFKIGYSFEKSFSGLGMNSHELVLLLLLKKSDKNINKN